jgi:hypothetical protein
LVLRRVAPAVAFMLALAGCGQQDSYDATKAALRDWLTAVHRGDASACSLMTANFRRELTTGRGTTCQARVDELAKSSADGALPAPDSAMEVPVWDPSREALVEVTDPGTNRVAEFWMQYADSGWLVAGQA